VGIPKNVCGDATHAWLGCGQGQKDVPNNRLPRTAQAPHRFFAYLFMTVYACSPLRIASAPDYR
jgi:hypothetical protein